jgi:hypothetical protein
MEIDKSVADESRWKYCRGVFCSLNWINSLMIKGKDDGKVSIERAKVDGMKASMVVPVAHPFLMKYKGVIVVCVAKIYSQKRVVLLW